MRSYLLSSDSVRADEFIGDNDANMLEGVTKEEVISLFLAQIHPSSTTRAKLSVHAASRKPREKKVSSKALEDLNAYIQEQSFVLPEGWQEGLGEEPAADTVVKAIRGALVDAAPETIASLALKLTELVEKSPAESDNKGTLKEGVVVIKDLIRFRELVTVSDSPKPLVDWNDLPVSKI